MRGCKTKLFIGPDQPHRYTLCINMIINRLHLYTYITAVVIPLDTECTRPHRPISFRWINVTTDFSSSAQKAHMRFQWKFVRCPSSLLYSTCCCCCKLFFCRTTGPISTPYQKKFFLDRVLSFFKINIGPRSFSKFSSSLELPSQTQSHLAAQCKVSLYTWRKFKFVQVKKATVFSKGIEKSRKKNVLVKFRN